MCPAGVSKIGIALKAIKLRYIRHRLSPNFKEKIRCNAKFSSLFLSHITLLPLAVCNLQNMQLMFSQQAKTCFEKAYVAVYQ